MPNNQLKQEFNLSSSDIHILFIADVIGEPGFEAMSGCIEKVKNEHHIDLTIANGENGSFGRGMTPKLAQSFFDIGIDVITSGNHIWNKDKIFPFLSENLHILRPLNYVPECPGHGSCIINIKDCIQIAVINLQGRSFMYPIDCPFRTADREIGRLQKEGIKNIIVDFHAEATAEKIALGLYLDGRISALIGTHTHVQTADEQILPKGTAYITDVGMTGPFDSVIGMEKEIAIRRFLTQLPLPYQVAHENPKFCGAILRINGNTGRAQSISRFQISPPGIYLKEDTNNVSNH
jgi:metallophosphoesterase (TIGR00282 family)